MVKFELNDEFLGTAEFKFILEDTTVPMKKTWMKLMNQLTVCLVNML